MANSWMSSWLGTSLSSCHQTGMSNCSVCHQIHSAFLWGEGSSVDISQRPSPISMPGKGISFPSRNSSLGGSREGGHSRSSSSGQASSLDQSDGSSVPSSSPQVSGWGYLALVSSPGPSSKVTCCLNYMGLGNWAHLLVGSPWHDAAWGTLV